MSYVTRVSLLALIDEDRADSKYALECDKNIFRNVERNS